MPSTSRASVARAAVATGLVIAALLLGGLSRILSGTEHHAFAEGALAPSSAHVTLGHTYHLSTPDGVKGIRARGADANTAQCEWSVGGAANQALVVAAAGESTKATDVVATFVAPYTGDIHVSCLGWDPMFIDDADDASGDYAGWLLLLATITLALGAAVGMAALRSAGLDSERASREDDEIERLVHAVHVRSEDREVTGTDPGDGVA
jgi:hypothetical protein